jgi:hypothetical protein
MNRASKIMERGLDLTGFKPFDTKFCEYEMTNCAHDSSYFISNYFRVEAECGPVGVMLDTPKEELIGVMETEQLTIGRYPRIYGKTTALVGFALHKARSKDTRNGWASLPSRNEEWKVETILSLSNPMYSADYLEEKHVSCNSI